MSREATAFNIEIIFFQRKTLISINISTLTVNITELEKSFQMHIPNLHIKCILFIYANCHQCSDELFSLYIRVGKKYRYAGIPQYFFGVVRTAAHLPVPWYSGVSIYSNRKHKKLQNIDRLEVVTASSGGFSITNH